VDGNEELRRRIQADVDRIRKYQMPGAGGQADYERIVALVRQWNDAADHTWDSGPIPLNQANRERALAAWKLALEKWTAMMQALPRAAGAPARPSAPAKRAAAPTVRIFTPWRGGLVRACNNPWCVMRHPKRHKPDVGGFLAMLRKDDAARKKLVDWFNNGPLA